VTALARGVLARPFSFAAWLYSMTSQDRGKVVLSACTEISRILNLPESAELRPERSRAEIAVAEQILCEGHAPGEQVLHWRQASIQNQ
jgi:hypothetical protein